MSKYNIKNDPNKDQEAQKYENPIPSRDVILQYVTDAKLPVCIENIAFALEIVKKNLFEGLTFRLSAMVRDGQLMKDKSYFGLPKSEPIYLTSKIKADREGRLELFSQSLGEKIGILTYQAKMVMIGDEVTAKVLGVNKKGRIEAEIKSIVSRGQTSITGYYFTSFDGHFIKPVSKNISGDIVLLPPKQKIEHNSLIEAEIVVQPTVSSVAVAKFTKEIEAVSPVKEAMMLASKKYDLIEEWSKQALTYVDNISNDILPDDRVDMRNVNFMTIDGADARDFDDAVYAQKTKTGGWKTICSHC